MGLLVKGVVKVGSRKLLEELKIVSEQLWEGVRGVRDGFSAVVGGGQ